MHPPVSPPNSSSGCAVPRPRSVARDQDRLLLCRLRGRRDPCRIQTPPCRGTVGAPPASGVSASRGPRPPRGALGPGVAFPFAERFAPFASTPRDRLPRGTVRVQPVRPSPPVAFSGSSTSTVSLTHPVRSREVTARPRASSLNRVLKA